MSNTFPLRGNIAKSSISEDADDFWVLVYKDDAARGLRGRRCVTHLSECFNGVGKGGVLHVHGNRPQACYAVQHAKNSLVLALFSQKSK